MKKYIALVLAIVIFVSLGCGCGSVSGSSDVAKVGSKDIQLTEVDTSQFPDAWEYDVYYWPNFGISSEIPAPVWSNRGNIMYDEADRFTCEVGYTTVDNFNNYKKALQDAGFTVNYRNSSDAYYGETETGVGVFICYYDSWYEMDIVVAKNDYLEELREYVG